MRTQPYHFRSTEEWKSSLMILPDSSFFDLMRSIFGNIKTPFNKQRLMEDLYALLCKDDIRNTIAGYIDEKDHELIAAAALLEDPAPEALEDFFQGDLNPVSLRDRLVNLEERLILFRFRDKDNKRRLALNPVLEPVLAPFAAQRELLFPFAEVNAETIDPAYPAQNSITDNRFLATLIAFISGEKEFLKVEGIRKKVLDQGKRLFPNLDLETAVKVLEQLGIFVSQGEKLLPEDRRIRDFGALSPENRREYWAAGLYFHLKQEPAGSSSALDYTQSLGFWRGRLRRIAFLMHRFCNQLDPQKQYPETSLLRFLRLLERETTPSPWEVEEKLHFRTFLKALKMTGILCPEESEKPKNPYWRIIPVVPAENSGPMIGMDSPFSFILYPGITFEHALKLTFFSSLKEDTPFGFELTRADVVRGFDQGINSEAIINLLKTLSGNRIDEGLEWTLKDWESRYTAVSLYEGPVLSLSEERRYLVKTEPMASLIRKTLAPGLYLLAGDSIEAVEALQKAGVDIIARPKQEAPRSLDFGSRSFPPLGVPDRSFLGSTDLTDLLKGNENSGALSASPHTSNEPHDPSSRDTRTSEDLKDHFRQHLTNLKIQSKAEKDELLARIERRVIFTEIQLEKAAIKFEKLEARLLDYPGKTAIAKQAIADGAPVEVSWPGPGGEITVTMGILQALEKKGAETILVLKPILDTENNQDPSTPRETIRISLGKISLLRRIKQSIFEE